MTSIRRRDLIASGTLAAGVLALGPSVWRGALAATTSRVGQSEYGPLQPADANGLQLPAGFRSREVARGQARVPGTDYRWHSFSDGQATYAAEGGEWILVSNSEAPRFGGGGVSALRFGPDGGVRAAYRICESAANCAGGPTPWGTWLTCEEMEQGYVYECDPLGTRAAVIRPAMGVFVHEAAAVDPVGRRIYLTEDQTDGCLYRFTPAAYPDLTAGVLEVAIVDGAGAVSWAEVRDPSASLVATRRQVPAATKFNGGEGIWYDAGFVYFTNKGDQRVWMLETATNRLELLYDPAQSGDDGFLKGPDNITVAPSGEIFVCEDTKEGDDFDIVVIEGGVAAPFLRAARTQGIHRESEFAGAVFSPDGSRLYFASQRAHGFGAVYEITGPFRPARRIEVPPRRGGEEQPPGGEQPPVGEQPPGGGQPPVTHPPGSNVPTIDDVDAPGLRIAAPRRIAVAALRRGGLEIVVRVDEASTLAATLRTQRGMVPGARGSQPRPVLATIGTARASVRAGRRTVALRLGRGEAARLEAAIARLRRAGRRGELRARLAVQARDAAGNVASATRTVVITSAAGPSRRPASRARRPARRGG